MTFGHHIKAEWHLITQSAWLKALLFGIPILLAVIMWAVFSKGIASDLPVGVVDNDNSVISRGLVRAYDATPSLQIKVYFNSTKAASFALKEGSIYAYVIIPEGLERDTLLGKSPQVTAFYNSQFILIGKLVSSALLGAHSFYVAQLDTLKDLVDSHGQLSEAIAEAVPIAYQITPLFNSNSHYGQFLVAAVIPAMWQILIIATLVIVVAAPMSADQGNRWLIDLNMTTLIKRLSLYLLIFWLQGITFVSVFYGVLHWPMHGSWLLLIIGQFLLVLACAGVATLLFFITLDVTRAMSLVAGLTAPAFAFMGVTFPSTDMPFIAQLWRSLLPISHYISIQIQQVNYATSLTASASHYLALIAFIGCFYLSKIILIKRQKILKTQPLNSLVESISNDNKRPD